MQQREQLSSLVWICTTTHQSSRVTVIDANSPADILETFHVTSSPILCIASVHGADEADYPADEEALKADLELLADSTRASPKPSPTHSTGSGGGGGQDSAQESGIGSITFVQCATGTTSSNVSAAGTPVGTPPKTSGRWCLLKLLKLGVFGRKLEESHFPFYRYFGRYWRK